MTEESQKETQPPGVSVHTGFPNPAADTSLRSLDLNQLLIRHSASTYFFRVRGHEWEDAGVFDDDIAIIDRAVDSKKSDTVIWWSDNSNEFNISKRSSVPDDATVWGVITATIHQLRTVTSKGKDLGQ
jgi:SOS-response transcriptional repressor LexA